MSRSQVYSASELARQELPKLDVSERGAVSYALSSRPISRINKDRSSKCGGWHVPDDLEKVLKDRLA